MWKEHHLDNTPSWNLCWFLLCPVTNQYSWSSFSDILIPWFICVFGILWSMSPVWILIAALQPPNVYLEYSIPLLFSCCETALPCETTCLPDSSYARAQHWSPLMLRLWLWFQAGHISSYPAVLCPVFIWARLTRARWVLLRQVQQRKHERVETLISS